MLCERTRAWFGSGRHEMLLDARIKRCYYVSSLHRNENSFLFSFFTCKVLFHFCFWINLSFKYSIEENRSSGKIIKKCVCADLVVGMLSRVGIIQKSTTMRCTPNATFYINFLLRRMPINIFELQTTETIWNCVFGAAFEYAEIYVRSHFGSINKNNR